MHPGQAGLAQTQGLSGRRLEFVPLWNYSLLCQVAQQHYGLELKSPTMLVLHRLEA